MAAGLLERFEDRVGPLLDDAYTLARHILRNEHDAQDVVQEAYLRAWRHYADFRGGDERPWLLTIVRNCCYTWQRSQRGRDDVSYDDDRHGLRESALSATDAKAVATSEREALASAIATLPPEFREALVLREIQGFSYREIAQITGVPIGTVMSRLARSRDQLRRSLKRTA